MPAIKSGPLSRAELQTIWEGAVDKGYREPFLAAGEGRGFEVWTQLFAQFERVSVAIDVTTQAMFISDWSGQTNPAASGEQKARVRVSFARALLPKLPVRLQAGTLMVEELTTDAGENGGVQVKTGRRYVLNEDVVFNPGEKGPFLAEVIAEKPGYGYNNPLPHTLVSIPQSGAGFENNHARVVISAKPASLNGPASSVTLVADNQPDMFVPGHVGQYILFTAGLNAGKVARMITFRAPSIPDGSSVDLELFWSVEVNTLTGEFVRGEAIRFQSPVAYGAVEAFDATTKRLAFVLLNGDEPVVGSTIEGVLSGATATVGIVLAGASFVAEAPSGGTGGASWRVLDWVADWGLTATNLDKPFGGRSGFLDELGFERAISRAPGEDDESYRARVREIADVVSPNAIRRALNRSLAGLPWCLREVGQSKFRGLFCDGTGEAPSTTPGRDRCDAIDYDTLAYTGTYASSKRFAESETVVLEDPATAARYVEGLYGRVDKYSFVLYGILTIIRKRGRSPASLAGKRVRGLRSGAIWNIDEEIENNAIGVRKFRTMLGYDDFRAYFLVGLPKISAGDFGIGYDAGAHNAFDAAPFANAYDGYATAAPPIWTRAYQAVDHARAGGVGFDVYREDASGCLDDDPNGEPLYLIDPLAMSGLKGYWREEEIHDDGTGLVDSWLDATGNGYDWAQAVAGDRPTFIDQNEGICLRRKGVRFDGTKFLSLAAPIGSVVNGWTIVFVGAPTVFGAPAAQPNNVPNTLFGDQAAGTAAFGAGVLFGKSVAYVSNAAFGVYTEPLAPAPRAVVGDGKVHVCAVTHRPDAGGVAEMNFDGIREASSSPYPWVAASFDTLGLGFGATDGFVGEVYAALLFDRVLTPKELRLLFYRFQVMYF